MEIAELIDQLAVEGPRLALAATRAGWDTPVPCTDWTVRELVLHVSGVHRWAADIVRRGSSTIETEAGRAVGTGPGDDELPGWFDEGHAALVAALTSAPPDLQAATFLEAPSPLAFWARRQAHETAIHRADAEAAAGGPVGEFPADFAQDGIGELLTGFAARSVKRAPAEGTIALRASDGPDWAITFGTERIVDAADPDAPADLEISATSSDLYLWVWNRRSDVALHGNEELVAAWRKAVRVRWV